MQPPGSTRVKTNIVAVDLARCEKSPIMQGISSITIQCLGLYRGMMQDVVWNL